MAGKFVRLSQNEQLRAALPVLLAAREEILRGIPPLEAIAEAGKARIECEYARRALRIATWEQNLLAWQEHKGLRQSDKTRAVDRAIALCKSVDARRGGWLVTGVAA